MSKIPANRNLFLSVKILIEQAQTHIVRNVNTTILLTYFEIGRMVVEDEQGGNKRADYARRVLKSLSTDLTKEFGKGYSVDNLQWMRRFYLVYQKYESLIHISSSGSTNQSKNESLIHKSTKFPFNLS